LGFYTEEHVITDVRRNRNNAIPGAFEIELDTPLTKPFVTDIQIGGMQLGDAIANLSRPGGDPVYHLNEAYVKSAFADAYVDVVTAPTSGVILPLYENMTEQNMVFVSSKWFAARTSPAHPPNNGLAVAGGTRASLAATNALSLGTTAGPYSYVWNENIDTATSGPHSQYPLLSGHNADKTRGEVLVHELAHQWNVNSGYANNECNRNAYSTPTKFCQGNGPQNSGQYDDDFVQFHYVGTTPATADSEYMTMRRADDPRP
jgi:hypothetical protein